MIHIAFMFMLGSISDAGAQCSWATVVLHDKHITDPTTRTRIDRLYEEAMAYRDRFLA